MSKNLKIESSFNTAIYGTALFVAGFILPLLLIVVVQFTGYSEIIEELAKALVVLFLVLKLQTRKLQISGGLVFGLLFGISESFFYLNNIFQSGDFSIFWQRLFWTVPMHIITMLILVLSALSRKWFLIFGLAGSIILHLLFNEIVSGL